MHHCAIEDPSNVVILSVNGLDLREVFCVCWLIDDRLFEIIFRWKKKIFFYLIMFFKLMPVKINYHFVSNSNDWFSSSLTLFSTDGFKTFPQLTHLDLSCNQIKNIKLNINDYETLEVKSFDKRSIETMIISFQELNLSYNNLTIHDMEILGMLPSLRVFYASGNDLVGLSRRLAKSYVHMDM